jgi:hypothetical protein
MKVSFKKELAILTNGLRIAYELEDNEPSMQYIENKGKYVMSYNLKGFGYVPITSMEESDEECIEFVDVLVNLTNA